MKFVGVLFLSLGFTLGSAAAQELKVYDVPRQLLYSAHNDDFTVKVRVPGGEWRDLFEYVVQVDMDDVQNASMAFFDFSGKVEVAVRKNNGQVNSVAVRPLSSGVGPQVKGNVIYFTLEGPRNLSVEVNGDKLRNLHLFANAIEQDAPQPNDSNVIYFGPGFHQPSDQPGNAFHVPSGKTVYLHGGAVVKAKFVCDRSENVRIMGRGIVYQPERGVELRNARNITIDGVIFINPQHYTVYGGATNNLTIRNLKSFSCKGWSDGIDLMSCNNVTIDNVFMRNSDDCIAVYGHRWDFYGNAQNYLVQNSVLWADIAHPINIGLHGDGTNGGDTISNLTFNNIDILEHDEDDRDYQGCMAISNSDNNVVKDVRFENIRIDDIQEGQLFNFRVLYNEKYSLAPGKGIENVVLKNISYNGQGINPSVVQGYSVERGVNGVSIQGLSINGQVVRSLKEAGVQVGEFTRGVQLVP